MEALCAQRAYQPQTDNPGLTVLDVVTLYLQHTKDEQSQRTYEDRAHILTEFAAAHPSLKIADCKRFHLTLWVKAHPEWRSDWTKKRAVGTLRRPFNWAFTEGLIERNPFLGITHRNGTRGEPMKDEHWRAMMRASSALFRRVLLFLRYTGCRPSEMSALRRENLDINCGVAILWEHKTSRTQREPKPRLIALHPIALRLVQWILRNTAGEYVFLNARGSPWKRYALACRIKRLRKALGLPARCRLYGLRHQFGSQAIVNGVPIKTLSALMGHSSTRTTEIYIHIENDVQHLQSAVAKVFRKQG